MNTGQSDLQALSNSRKNLSWEQIEIAKMFSALEADGVKAKFEVQRTLANMQALFFTTFHALAQIVM